ncbi:hypothetical protein ACQ33O_11815 [Ferruginibacter sp. SUN002]|uniref:hypothetical protein n=1 Tax=Ferruginibacter sp. SUN002 TaxID=2937789 RepID=UPI003D36A884
MKIEQLLVQHLYNTKELSLQGIGRFLLNSSVALPLETDKEFTMPDNAISFEYNLKTEEDASLVNFISQQTGKIKPLASADLDSYIILTKQFLNIGKPFTVEGIGTVQKNQQGEYEFIPGSFITPKIDDIPRQLKEKRDESVSFESESKNKGGNKKMLAAFIILLIAIIGIAVYYLAFNGKNATVQTASAPPADTVAIDTAAKTQVKDTVAIANNLTPADSTTFKVVVKEYYTKDAAEKSLAKLTSYGHKLSLTTKDSLVYKIVMSFNRPLSDTLKVRDSLKFLGRTYIELK